MKAVGKTVDEILINLPEDRVEPFNKLHDVIMKNLPKGFEAGISYGGLGYVVPHTVYPDGYHCKPIEPLPFAGIASQKQSINFYHMGIYADPKLLDWLGTTRVTTQIGFFSIFCFFTKTCVKIITILRKIFSKRIIYIIK